MTRQALASQVVRRLQEVGALVGLAESLTGGLLTSALVDIPGSSQSVRGGVVAYATDLKASVLGVDAALLSAGGPVQKEVAVQMARGVSQLLEADWGVSTTGVAGPGATPDGPAGLVYVAVVGPGGVADVERLLLCGDRGEVRAAAVEAALTLLLARLG